MNQPDLAAARNNLIGFCLAATPNEATFERAERLADAYRDALLATVQSPADRAALRERVAVAVAECLPTMPQFATHVTNAVLAVLPTPADRAVVRAETLREAAGLLERINPDRSWEFSEGVDWAVDSLRRLAGEQPTQDEAASR